MEKAEKNNMKEPTNPREVIMQIIDIHFKDITVTSEAGKRYEATIEKLCSAANLPSQEFVAHYKAVARRAEYETN